MILLYICIISEKTAIRIYKCMIRPHLDYIDFTIDSGSADRIQKLDNLQKKAVRRIEYCECRYFRVYTFSRIYEKLAISRGLKFGFLLKMTQYGIM